MKMKMKKLLVICVVTGLFVSMVFFAPSAFAVNLNDIPPDIPPLSIALMSEMQEPSQTYKVTKTLIASGADVNAATDRGVTPLMFAVMFISKGVLSASAAIDILLDAGADAGIKNKEGKMAIHYLAFWEMGEERSRFEDSPTGERLTGLSYPEVAEALEEFGNIYDVDTQEARVIDEMGMKISEAFGRNADEIREKLGKPIEYYVHEVDNVHNPKIPMLFETFVYDGIEMEVMTVTNEKAETFISAMKFSLPKYEIDGVKIGGSPEAITSRLPAPSKRSDSLLRYSTSYTTMDIHLNGGKIASVEIRMLPD